MKTQFLPKSLDYANAQKASFDGEAFILADVLRKDTEAYFNGFFCQAFLFRKKSDIKTKNALCFGAFFA